MFSTIFSPAFFLPGIPIKLHHVDSSFSSLSPLPAFSTTSADPMLMRSYSPVRDKTIGNSFKMTSPLVAVYTSRMCKRELMRASPYRKQHVTTTVSGRVRCVKRSSVLKGLHQCMSADTDRKACINHRVQEQCPRREDCDSCRCFKPGMNVLVISVFTRDLKLSGMLAATSVTVKY